MQKKRWLLAVLIGLVAALWLLNPFEGFSIERFQESRAAIEQWRDAHWLQAAAIYFLLYIVVAVMSLPFAALTSLIGGALFGLIWGMLLVSFASSIGALLAFGIARTLLHDWVQTRFGQYLKVLNRGVARDGHFYLFALRLVPVVPFAVINLVMALTPMRPRTFYWVSQVGMLPATFVFVNAGTQLSQLDSGTALFSPELIGSFALLAIFPWLARHIMRLIQRRRALRGFRKPRRFDYNLLVIGAGSGGLVASYIAATVKAKVGLIERERMGGDCLNTGCVPSKALIRSSHIAHTIQRAEEFGVHVDGSAVDFAAVMERVQSVVERIEPHDSVERYTQLGVDCIQGQAEIQSPWEVLVDGRLLSARNIVVATGGRPRLPDIPGIESSGYLTSDTVWQLRERPRRLLVLGAGPIGCELAQAFHRLGSEVSVVEMFTMLPREDSEVADALRQQFVKEGIALYECAKPLFFDTVDDRRRLVLEHDFQRCELEFDQLLVAAGRAPNTENLGLARVGVRLRDNGTIDVDRQLRSSCPTIFACGDVTGPYQFTHVASHQAWYAAVNSLFGAFRQFSADYSVIPWVTFCDPEIARVGLSEREAEQRGIDVEVTRFDLAELDRAIADGEARGFVKVLTAPGRDKILGATIVGYRASELLAEFVMAMRHGLGLGKIMATIHPYPTLGEANKYTAGEWRKAHKPETLLRWVERYHRWRRG